jgi:hypothetical protein
MIDKSVRFFAFSSGVVFMATAMAKLISGIGSARILDNPDPIFYISFRKILWIAGGLELLVALICLFGRQIQLQSWLVACLSTNFALYRIGLWLIGWHTPCSCLGNITDVLHIPPQTADTAMKIILAYLLIGSYASLFWLWRQHQKVAVATLPVQ